MANRSRRNGGGGSAASLLVSRMTDDVFEEELPAENDEADDIKVIEEEPEPEENFLPDYSHEQREEPAVEDEPEDEDDAAAALQAQIAALREQNTQLEQRVQASETNGLHADLARIEHGATQVRSALTVAKQKLSTAGKAGDWDAVAEAQAEIAQITHDLNEFDAAAADIQAAIKAPRKPAKAEAQATDQFEKAIAGMSPASQDWCRKNKADLTSDPRRAELATTAARMALMKGHASDSPEFFAYVNSEMGYGDTSVTTKQQKPRPKPAGAPRVAAPGGHRAAPARGPAKEVALSRAEIQIAQSMGMSTKEYAASKAQIIKNGEDPNRGGPRYSTHLYNTK